MLDNVAAVLYFQDTFITKSVHDSLWHGDIFSVTGLFVRGIHRSAMGSLMPYKGTLTCCLGAFIVVWLHRTNNRLLVDSRRHGEVHKCLVHVYFWYSGQIGPTGIKGDVGDTGETGVTGLIGETGATGVSGSRGQTGSPGLQGGTGSTGETGPQGPEGPLGATGWTGSQGVKGTMGSVGSTGPEGGIGKSVYVFFANIIYLVVWYGYVIRSTYRSFLWIAITNSCTNLTDWN